MDSNASSVKYEYRLYLPRSEMYAIKLAGLEVVGVYGPLEYHEVLFSSLPFFPYEETCDELSWIKSSLSDFVPCANEYEECTIWI